MDSQSYLNQISNSSNLTTKKTNFFSSKLFIFIVSSIVAFIAMAIIGGVLNSNKNNIKNTTISLSIHTANLISTISTYQPNLKSSELRGYSASLSNILSETSSTLSTYIEEKYDTKQSNYDESLIESEKILSDSINNELFSAKINGVLDRVYAYTIAHEIATITAYESEIFNSLDDNTKTSIQSSYNSLVNLYDKFNNFSES